MLPFSLSGSLKSLPELHRALAVLHNSCQVTPPLPEDFMEMAKDKHGMWDITDNDSRIYCRKIMVFGDFRLFIRYFKNILYFFKIYIYILQIYYRYHEFPSSAGGWSGFMAIHLTKKKSEAAKKSSRSTERTFFAVRNKKQQNMF